VPPRLAGSSVEEEVSSSLSFPGALMPFYPVMPPDATLGCAEDAVLGLPGQAGRGPVRVAGLACPARRGLGWDGRTALTAAGAGRIRPGDLVVWLKPVAVAPAVVRRDGRVQAAGHPADHARLGVAGGRLDELCGIPGVMDQIARSAVRGGRVKGAARRAMSPALAIRFTMLMTLMPDADYPAVMEALPGDLVLVPWQRPCRVPAAAVACTWREAPGPVPLERLRDLALAGAGRRAPQPLLPRRHGGRPGGRLDRRVADPGAGHPGEPGGVRVCGHRG